MLRLVTLAAVLAVIGGLAGAFAFSEVSGIGNSPAGRVIEVAEDLTTSPVTLNAVTGFFDTDDCREIVVFVDSTADPYVYLHLSVDGIGNYGRLGNVETLKGDAGLTVKYFQSVSGDPIVAPQVAVEFVNRSSQPTTIVNRAWLYCSA